MKRKQISRLMATILTMAMLLAYLTPLGTIFAYETFTDEFDNATFTSQNWVTDRHNTAGTLTAYNVDTTNTWLRPTYHATAYSAYTYLNPSSPTTNRIKTAEVKVKLNTTTKNVYSTPIMYYYDPLTKGSAGIELGKGNNTNGTLMIRNSTGANASYPSVSGGTNTTTTDVADNTTTNKWFTINFTYDYTSFNAATRQLKVTFTIKRDDGTVIYDQSAVTRTVSLGDYASQNVSFAFANDNTNAANTTDIDYFKVLTTETFSEADTASMFQTKFASLLAKTTGEVTVANDDATISQALVVYKSLSDNVKALLTTEYNKLISLRTAIKASPMTDDTFDNSTTTNAVWITEKANSGATPNPNYSVASSLFTPAKLAAATIFSRPRDSYTADTTLNKVTVKIKAGGSGWYGGNFLYYYDPVTKLYAGLELNNSALSGTNYLSYRATSTIYQVYQSGFSNTNLSGTPSLPSLTAADIQTLECTYDYTNFNAATRQLKVTFKWTNDTTGVSTSSILATITLPSYASQTVAFAISGTTDQTNTPKYDRVTPEYQISNQEIANAFKTKYATLLAKNVTDVTIATDADMLGNALTEYSALSQVVKDILIADGTYAKLTDMNNYLKGQVPDFSTDTFDSSFTTANYWSTVKMENVSATLTSNYATGTYDSTSVLNLPRVTGDSADVGNVYGTYIDPSYLTNSKFAKTTIRLYMTQDKGYADGRLYFFYDPATNMRAGIDMTMGNGTSTTAMIRPIWDDGTNAAGSITKTGSNMSCGVQTAGWYKIEASYNYFDFTETTRQLKITYNITRESDNTKILINGLYTYTLTADAFNTKSSQMNVALGYNSTGDNKARIDYVSIDYDAPSTASSIAETTKTAAVGDTISSLALPTTVSVTNSNNITVSVKVTWDTAHSNYNGSALGTYTIYGDLLAAGAGSLEEYNMTNPSNIRAVCTVTVKTFLMAGAYKMNVTTIYGITPSSGNTFDVFEATRLRFGTGVTHSWSGLAYGTTVGTGTTLSVTFNSNTTVYTFLIYGDVDGDSEITVTDLAKIKMHLLHTTQIPTVIKQSAADVNRTGTISISDLISVKKQLLGLTTITQS